VDSFFSRCKIADERYYYFAIILVTTNVEQIQNIFAYDCFFTLIRLQFNASSLLEREIDGAVTRITAQFWSEPQIVTEAQHVDIAAMCNDFNMHL